METIIDKTQITILSLVDQRTEELYEKRLKIAKEKGLDSVEVERLNGAIDELNRLWDIINKGIEYDTRSRKDD